MPAGGSWSQILAPARPRPALVLRSSSASACFAHACLSEQEWLIASYTVDSISYGSPKCPPRAAANPTHPRETSKTACIQHRCRGCVELTSFPSLSASAAIGQSAGMITTRSQEPTSRDRPCRGQPADPLPVAVPGRPVVPRRVLRGRLPTSARRTARCWRPGHGRVARSTPSSSAHHGSGAAIGRFSLLRGTADRILRRRRSGSRFRVSSQSARQPSTDRHDCDNCCHPNRICSFGASKHGYAITVP
jgi:hypothetical protein